MDVRTSTVPTGTGDCFSPFSRTAASASPGGATPIAFEGARRALPPDRDLSEVRAPSAGGRPSPQGEYAKRYPDRNEESTAADASGGYTL